MVTSDKTCLVFDRGSKFLPFAQKLGEGFRDVLYFTEWRAPTWRAQDAEPGWGMENVTRVDSFWQNVDAADLIVFPFILDGDLQEYLRDQGKAVWGTGRAETLELDREGFKKILGAMEMPVAKTHKIIGTDALREFFLENEDHYVKTTFNYGSRRWAGRADFETFHHVNWKLSEDWLLDLSAKLGPRRHQVVFLVEESVSGIEPGWDGYTVDGDFPDVPLYSFELKDAGYAGTCERMSRVVDDAVREVFRPILKSFGARGNFHVEMRWSDDHQLYITDPCARQGSPVIEGMLEMISNWPEIVWHGAHGELVQPEYTAKWVAEITLKSQWHLQHYLTVSIPDPVRQWIKLDRAVKYGDEYVCIPTPATPDDIFGNAVGLGDTLEEAWGAALEAAESIEASGIEYKSDGLSDLEELFARDIP